MAVRTAALSMPQRWTATPRMAHERLQLLFSAMDNAEAPVITRRQPPLPLLLLLPVALRRGSLAAGYPVESVPVTEHGMQEEVYFRRPRAKELFEVRDNSPHRTAAVRTIQTQKPKRWNRKRRRPKEPSCKKTPR